MRRILLLPILFITLILISCQTRQSKPLTVYQQAIDEMLQNDTDVNRVDYITFFIKQDTINEKDLSIIEHHLQQTYDKDTYSYTVNELKGTGAYGKEDLNQDGIYTYITKTIEENDTLTIHGEKYSTLEKAKAIGMEITFTKSNQSWLLKYTEVKWEEIL